MKKILILVLSVLIFAGCGNRDSSLPTDKVSVPQQQNSNNSLIVSSRQSENQPKPSASAAPKSGTKTQWTQSGTPIDTSELDAAIAKAEKDLKAKPKDDAAKKSLAEAYVKRGLALSNVQQYASALGDFRRALKNDSSSEVAKEWIDRIVGIYDSMDRQYPQEGEEPPPLPFNKKT